MDARIKSVARRALGATKKVIASNPHTKRAAVKIKRTVISALGPTGAQEIYELHSYYPTINEFYNQQQDPVSKTDPLISILLPTYNTPETFLRECIESIIVQSYGKWELCIADDNSPDKNVVKIIQEYQAKDARIKLVQRKKNGHISEATNSALKLASGDFVALMDHDDVLWPNALYEFVNVIRSDKTVDFIYSDEDKIDGTGKVHSYPFLKPDFSPEFLESCNYITHFSCIRKTIMEEVGGFRKGYEGAQDWDLFIRISALTSNIVHIPKLLYSWRIHEASTASDTDAKPYVYEAQLKLLEDHVKRSGRDGVVETGIITQHRTIKYALSDTTKAAIIILVHDYEDTEALRRSYAQHAPGLDAQVIIAHSVHLSAAEQESFKDVCGADALFVNIEADAYSTVIAVTDATELVFIDGSIELASNDWAKILVADVQTEGVAAVGPVLLTQDGQTVKSAGLGVGYGGGVVDMLAGMPFNDPHYSRGLYVKSRRNVTAINPLFFAIKRSALMQRSNKETIVDLLIRLSSADARHIYTPYVQAKAVLLKPLDTVKDYDGYEDRMLNPNFDHTNERMEVRR